MTRHPYAILRVQRATSACFGVHFSALRGQSRERAIAHPRQDAMWLARRLTGHSLAEIGAAFGGRDHSTVAWAIARAEARRRSNPAHAALLDTLAAGLAEALTEDAQARAFGALVPAGPYAEASAILDRLAGALAQLRVEARHDPESVLERLRQPAGAAATSIMTGT